MGDSQRFVERSPVDALDAQRVLANVSAGLFGAAIARPKVGRFPILDQVGAGAMGVVYSAFDPELDRKVAIKVLHDRPDGDQARSRARMLREARALAKLAHPNVATVYEVGTVDDRVFLAMEFVAGQPLDQWLQQPRSWREVVAVFAAAGAGLAAAHAAGIVHRDFKPANVVMGEDRRVRVLDFGLAKQGADMVSVTASGESSSHTSHGVGESTTTQGLAGTPAYMAPEQHRGEPAVAASDQFAFCVSLFEALYGARPFNQKTRTAIVAAIENNEIAVPDDRKVPRWLHRAVARGLSADPEARWASMSALLVRIGDDPALRWRRRVLPAAGVLLAGAGLWALSESRSAAPCQNATADLDRTWSATTRATVDQAITAAEGGEGAMSARVLVLIDGYVDALRPMQEAACHSAHADPPTVGSAARVDCLAARAQALEAAVDVLRDPSKTIVSSAASMVPTIAGLQVCDALPRTNARSRADPSSLEDFQALVARGKVLLDVGQIAEGLTVAKRAVAVAQASGDPRLLARALVRQGRAEMINGARPAAETTLQEALVAAERADDPEARGNALRVLARALVETSKLEQAERMADLASATHERFENLPLDWELDLEEVYGELASARDDHELALVHYRKMEALTEGPTVGTTQRILAKIAVARGLQAQGSDLDGAVERLEEVIALARDAFGPDHRVIAVAHGQLGALYYRLNRPEDAAVAFTGVVEARERLLGPDHPKLAPALLNLGSLMTVSNPRGALPVLDRALRLVERVDGKRSARGVQVRTMLARAHEKLGDRETARALLTEVVETSDALELADSKRIRPMVRLAEIEIELGDCRSALPRLAEVDKKANRDQSRLHEAIIRMYMAQARCSAQADQGEQRLREAVGFARSVARTGEIPARANLELARSLVDNKPAEALALAREARTLAPADDAPSRELRIDIDRFLAEHADVAG